MMSNFDGRHNVDALRKYLACGVKYLVQGVNFDLQHLHQFLCLQSKLSYQILD